MNGPEKAEVQRVLERLSAGDPLPQALGFSEEDVRQIETLAVLLYQEGKLESALRLLQGLVSLHVDRAAYWSALGAVLTRMERHEEAIPVLTLALRMDPNDTAALVNRGECYIALGRAEEAGADLERAIELDPKETDPASNRARQLAYGLYQMFDQAREEGLDTVEVEEEA